MSSYNARVPAGQQYQLIMECRNSGIFDYQWCKERKRQVLGYPNTSTLAPTCDVRVASVLL